MTESSHHAALHTRVCELFGVEHPIVQTGMGWVSGARLTAARSRSTTSAAPPADAHPISMPLAVLTSH